MRVKTQDRERWHVIQTVQMREGGNDDDDECKKKNKKKEKKQRKRLTGK